MDEQEMSRQLDEMLVQVRRINSDLRATLAGLEQSRLELARMQAVADAIARLEG